MERPWKLGDDLFETDNLLDQVTFDDLILAVHCNSRVIDKQAVKRELHEIIESRFEDMNFLLERNLDEIICRAKIGRGGYENERGDDT